eukprot:TRINITY_DN2689_c0_g1_i1.p1 TRINITY_DN2689_c0_g1~~TRINITY_DN2689_c0_g1_i1.p1  ORF type:complete len:342 (+),score=79.28 TRINITY_DN2689_c0_g1_i1:57-1082(+)
MGDARVQAQIRSFTAWVNDCVRKHDLQVSSLETDLRDGRVLIRLAEYLTGQELMSKYNTPAKKPRIANIANVQLALDAFSKAGSQIQCTAADIVDGNRKMILGLLFTLIHHYRISAALESGAKSLPEAQNELLKWCSEEVKPYNVTVNDINGFKDGRAFAALVHKRAPGDFSFEDIEKVSPKDRLQQAFGVAARKLQIPQLLQADDVVDGHADNVSVLAYLSYFRLYKGEVAIQQEKAADRAQVEELEATIRRLQAELAAAHATIAQLRAAALAAPTSAATTTTTTPTADSSGIKSLLQQWDVQLQQDLTTKRNIEELLGTVRSNLESDIRRLKQLSTTEA